MDRPKRFGYEDITTEQQERWEKKYGEYWADKVEPEHRTTIWDFDTLEQLRAWVNNPACPASGYFGRAFERVNVHYEYGWAWDTKEIEL